MLPNAYFLAKFRFDDDDDDDDDESLPVIVSNWPCTHSNLVELEKCCRTHIFLQNFVLIQPRTSPLKICKILQNLLILLTLTP